MVHQTPIKKKEPGFRVVDGLWYIDICVDSFLSANRQSPIPLKQGESTSFKKRGWKKNYPIDGDIVGFTSFYAIVDWLYGNIM